MRSRRVLMATISTNYLCVDSKVFYCNGMTTSLDDAEIHTKKIQKITKQEVELHHNDTTPEERALESMIKMVLGILGVSYAVASEKKSKEKKLIDTAIGVSSACLVASALQDYVEIQKQKNRSAEELAGKAITYLKRNPLSHVTFVFHSQGTDIGQRTLHYLNDLKERIHVVTIGGMVSIYNELAHRVVNFQNIKDLVSKGAQGFFDWEAGARTRVATKNRSCETSFCHGSVDYLSHGRVKDVLYDLSRPKFYHVMRRS